MIVRHYANCDNCNKVTLLRLGVGHQEDQHFQLDCENCSQNITGCLHTDQKRGQVNGFTLEGATSVSSDHHDFVFTYHPDYPTVSTREVDTVSSPFIQAYERYGPDIMERGGRSVGMQMFAKENINNVRRLVKNYKNKNWERYKKDILIYLPDDTSLEHPIDRNAALYRILEIILMPIFTCESHVRTVEFNVGYIDQLARTKRSALVSLFQQLRHQHNYLQALQHDALDLVLRFMSSVNEFQQIFADWDPDNPDLELPEDLLVVEKSGFHQVKSLYLDSYELLARGLSIVTGLTNIKHRGKADIYPANPRNSNGRAFAQSVVDFQRKPHGQKAALLAEEPAFENWLANSLDNKLRNAIGHNTIEYNSVSSTITYKTGRDSKKTISLTYGNFLIKALRGLYRTHEMNHLMKVCFIYQQALADGKF